MAQTLLLGLGGTGSRIVNGVAAELKKKGFFINDGQICCAVLDTNENDRKKIKGSGVGIPVVPTSKDRIISDYIGMYSNKGVRSWMPISPDLLKQNMLDGASQIRYKSRLAFMDTIEDRTIYELESQIDKLFNDRDDTKIRVMVVSSLAGGTGSGMFIQAALWLREYFSKRKCAVTIRGIFVLPDVFIKTVSNMRNDNSEIQSLYANAYAAIRELNAITKIKTKGMKTLLPVKIDNLFDSEEGQPDGENVYDYVFFVDDVAEGGAALNDIDQYEQIVARLVYMQLYAPMDDELYSVEDNLFKRFQKSKEPVYGACGTAKAIYPSDDILRYCALRAAQDSLSSGWRRIDKEIAEKKRKEEEKEKSGTILKRRVNLRFEFIRLFDSKTQKTGDQIGIDRFFTYIANDIKNEKHYTSEDGETDVIEYSDKVEDFVNELEKLIALSVDSSNPGDLSRIKLKKDWIDKTTDTVENLIKKVEENKKAVERFTEDINDTIPDLAEEIIDLICPSDMGDANPDNVASILGMFTKKDSDNKTYFIHPIAVRYLLYKLLNRVEEIKTTIHLENALSSAKNGYGNGKKQISFDNPRTKKIETDPNSYLTSRGFFDFLRSEEKHLKRFKTKYSEYNNVQFELCRAYAIAYLKSEVLNMLSAKMKTLTEIIEEFFKNLEKVSNSLDDAVAENIRKNNQIEQKTIYVCASEKEKEELYNSLSLNLEDSNVNINKIIVRALYGQFCSKENTVAENNKEYRGRNVEDVFYNEVISTFSDLILLKNKNDVDLDIYSAICKSADIEYQKEQEGNVIKEHKKRRLNIDLETGEALDSNLEYQRHVEAIETMVKRLRKLGAPLLISDEELPDDLYAQNDDHDAYKDDEAFMQIKKPMTFWGVNPDVAEACPSLATILGGSLKMAKNSAYAKNELDCYRAVYGIQAGYIAKFNEIKNGDYYKNYQQVVRDMVAEVREGHDDALIHTPHLDKTWHLFLPYITPEKQIMEENRFYRSFWLAIAYGMISLDKDGEYQIERLRKTSTGYYTKHEPVFYNCEKIGKVHVQRLIAALRLDGSFVVEAEQLDEKFKKECQNLDAYEGTEFLRGKIVKETKSKTSGETIKSTIGGLASDKDTNAMTIIVRYHNSPRNDVDVTAMLIQTLEKLCCELVSNKYKSYEEGKIKLKGYELCKRIYTSSSLRDKDIELISHWKDAWSKKSVEE